MVWQADRDNLESPEWDSSLDRWVALYSPEDKLLAGNTLAGKLPELDW